MSKDIRKNREALVRHLYSIENIRSNRQFECACVKHNIFYCFNLPQEIENFGGTPAYDPELNTLLGMNERLFEERKSMHEVADWLQTLPGWPRVL